MWYLKENNAPDMQYTGTNSKQFDKLVRVVLGGDGDEVDYNVEGTNLLITETYHDIGAIAEKINTLKERGAQRVLIPYRCSDPSNPLNYFTGLKSYMPQNIYDLVNRSLPYNHYVILDVSIEDDSRTSITLYDPAHGSRLDKDLIMNQLNNFGDYEQKALGLQDAYGSDSVNCGKYIMMFILYLSNYEKNKGPLEIDGFEVVADDRLYLLIHNQNFDLIRTKLFRILQEMMNSDNQSMSNQVEAMSSNAAIDNDEEFEMIDDISVETQESLRVTEEENIQNLRRISLNIGNILRFLDQRPKYADKVQAEKEGVLQEVSVSRHKLNIIR